MIGVLKRYVENMSPGVRKRFVMKYDGVQNRYVENMLLRVRKRYVTKYDGGTKTLRGKYVSGGTKTLHDDI